MTDAGAAARPGWERWRAEFGDRDAEAVAAAYDDVVRRMDAPGRHYHTLRHVLAVLDTLGPAAPRPVRLAAWLHDVVYDPLFPDNEERSAMYARFVLSRLGEPPEVVEEVARLIVTTKTHDATDEAAALLADADLGVLAARPESYDTYVAAVRREYAWATDEEWRAGRTAVLGALLAQPRLFKTGLLPGAEERARANMERELAALRQPDAATRPEGRGDAHVAEVGEVVRSLIELIRTFREAHQADSLATLLAEWTDPGTAPARRDVLAARLHRLVPGMGGLIDLYLPGNVPGTDEPANDRLASLADRLYALTKPDGPAR